MSIRETSRGLSRQARDRWPLDTTTELNSQEFNSQEGNYVNVPQVQNHFAVDGPGGLNLTPAQKRQLLDQLLKEAATTGGEVIDLSKPVGPPYVFREYPKMVYHHTSGHVLEVANAAEEKAAVARGFKSKPAADRDYSQTKAGNVAPSKPVPDVVALPEEETINAEELLAQEQAAVAEEAPAEEASSSRRRR